MEKIQKNGRILYQCKECGFHYANPEWAEKCEAWCKEHHSCNLENYKLCGGKPK